MKVGELPALLSLGLQLRDLSGDQAKTLPGSPDQAVLIVSVMRGSPAFQAHLVPGMRVLAVGNRAVSTKAEAEAAATAANPAEGVALELTTPQGHPVRAILGGSPSRRP